MLSEVMEYYGFKQPLDHLGFFETEHHAHLVRELKIVIGQGRLVALAGIVGYSLNVQVDSYLPILCSYVITLKSTLYGK